ncbi:hypothetical protein [Shewanella sp. 10N.286.48.B5]|uniref:hypothetical protein n=1 Tax=Shewanella sp. 10N.286.48.B5 TaxID=1880834 RepID=UPI000C83B2AB|nr:hypothetical protein [Shewanella sp. 10N.286.48.B5]PMH88921.1 hypothetical protein BCU57_19050 [Shewanella sp. 10N.286.48.B5]
MKKVLFIGILLSLISACESSQDIYKNRESKSDMAENSVSCEMLSRTGSNRKTKVCRTAKQKLEDEKNAEDSLTRLQKNGATVGN